MKKLAVHEGTVLVPEPMFDAMASVVEAVAPALLTLPLEQGSNHYVNPAHLALARAHAAFVELVRADG